MQVLWQGYALDASADRSVIVGGTGQSHSPGGQAMRWSGGMAQGIVGGKVANAVSADGSVVVGATAQSAVPGRAFHWTAATGMQLLPSIEPGTGGYAYDVSADGNVIVGYGNPSGGDRVEAFRWTAGTGTVGLGYCPAGRRRTRSRQRSTRTDQ